MSEFSPRNCNRSGQRDMKNSFTQRFCFAVVMVRPTCVP